MAELSQVCNLELRHFDPSWLHPEVFGSDKAHLKMFSWKLAIIAQLFQEMDAERDLLIYADTSIMFKSGDWSEYVKPLDDGRIAPIQLGSPNSGHINQIATNEEMYSWLPPDPQVPPLHQWEANQMTLRKTEAARQMLKW